MVAAVGDHQIVHDPARRVGEHPVALPPFGKPDHIDRHEGFQRRTVHAQDHLTHMAYVEQPGGGAGVQVFLHHAQRILHRHFPAREGHHLAAALHVQIE